MNKKNIPVPEIAEKYGMRHLVFEDDFDSYDTIDINGEGTYGYKWYTTRPFRAKPLTTEDFRIENSVLYLEQHDSLYNYGLATVNPRTRQGFTFNKGVLEFRFRIPYYQEDKTKYTEPDCGGPAIWSFPPDKIYDSAREWVEMDWMEYWGTHDGTWPGGHYTTTYHHTRRDTMHDKGVTGSNWAGHAKAPQILSDARWHTMTFLWDTGIVNSWLDGEQAVCQIFDNGRVEPPIKFKHGEPFENPFEYMNEQFVALIINGAKNNPLEIDWIRVWQR